MPLPPSGDKAWIGAAVEVPASWWPSESGQQPWYSVYADSDGDGSGKIIPGVIVGAYKGSDAAEPGWGAKFNVPEPGLKDTTQYNLPHSKFKKYISQAEKAKAQQRYQARVGSPEASAENGKKTATPPPPPLPPPPPPPLPKQGEKTKKPKKVKKGPRRPRRTIRMLHRALKMTRRTRVC